MKQQAEGFHRAGLSVSIPNLRTPARVPEGRFQRSLRHDDVEREVEGDEHDGGEQEGA